MQPVIYCEKLIKNYGPKKILKELNLTVPAGSIFALLGTNGAGKTTLIRTLLGLIPASGGTVRVLGAEPYKIGAALRQKIGYVSEDQGLYPWMRVKDIIRFCKPLYLQWDEALVEKYLKRFKLKLETRIGALSKGQTTKLALILALAPKPELLILDEPMSGLDPLAQHEFLQVIQRDIRPEGRSVFFSTHNLADVEASAEKVAIVFDGRVQACGSIAEICQQVAKVKTVPGPPLPFTRQVPLYEEPDGAIVLVPAQECRSSNPGTNVRELEPVTLHEAFLFFCAEEV